jgi:hypothetical protein
MLGAARSKGAIATAIATCTHSCLRHLNPPGEPMTHPVSSFKIIVSGALLAFVGVPLTAQTGPEVARAFGEANEVSILRDFAELLS